VQSGQPPFSEGNVLNIQYQHVHEPVPPWREKLPDLAPKVEAVIMQALAKQPVDRFPTVHAFAEALEAASSKPPIGTRLLIYRGHGYGEMAFYLWYTSEKRRERGPMVRIGHRRE
jgi:hypothetical protein